MKITTLDKTVADLLKEFLFIPRFQRPYDWEREQVDQFWMDTIVDNGGEYFIGAVVLYKQADSFGIVDGQQRVTTILMTLCAVRDAFEENKLDSFADAIQAILEKVDRDNIRRFVLNTETSYPYVQDMILNRSKKKMTHKLGAEERVLSQTYTAISKKIAEALTSPVTNKPKKIGRPEYVLKNIRDQILNLKLITVELDNEDDAYLIFETLNTRGKDLQVSHLLKNHLSRLLKPKNSSLDPLKIKWAKLLATFESSQADVSVDIFLHHFWLSTREKYVTAKNLFVAMKREITTADQAEELMDDLISDADLYRSIVEPSFRKWKKEERALRGHIEALSVFRMRQPFPLVLSIIRAYNDKAISKKNAESMLWAIERFHFAFTAISSKSSSGGLSFMYASWARSIYEANKDREKQKAIKNVVDGLDKRHPTEDDFVAGFKELRFSDELTKQKKLVQYVLRNIADHLAKPGVASDHDQMTIEHIASQNPSGSTSVSADHVAMVGNMLWCDTHLQHKLGNKSFADKLTGLRNNPVPGSEEIVKHRTWGEREIDARTDALARLAYKKVWI